MRLRSFAEAPGNIPILDKILGDGRAGAIPVDFPWVFPARTLLETSPAGTGGVGEAELSRDGTDQDTKTAPRSFPQSPSRPWARSEGGFWRPRDPC